MRFIRLVFASPFLLASVLSMAIGVIIAGERNSKLMIGELGIFNKNEKGKEGEEDTGGSSD